MGPYSNIIRLNHSPILDNPILGSVFYIIQLILVKLNITSMVWMSNKSDLIKDSLIKMLNQKNKKLVCTSHKFGRSLSKFKNEIILDENVSFVKNLSTNEAYNLMWTLVNSTAVTKKTESSLGDFLPNDFPVDQDF